MTWTPHHNIRLAREICGYEVQTSPRGKHYIIEDGKTRPLPDFPNDPGETLTTLDAWLLVTGGTATFDRLPDRSFSSYLQRCGGYTVARAPRLTAAIAGALYLTLPPEV